MEKIIRNERKVPVFGGELHCESFGNDMDPAILMIMGATASMLWWPDAMCESLAEEGYFVIRYDQRDTGQSTTNEYGVINYDLMQLSDDVLAILASYEADHAHLMGMSLGGLIAQITALRAPQIIDSLILIGSEPLGGTTEPLPTMDESFLEHLDGLADLDWKDEDAVREFLLGVAHLTASPNGPFDEAGVLERINAEMARTSNMQSAFNHAMLSGELSNSFMLSDITQPILIIHGEDDTIVPIENGEVIYELAQDAELLIMEGTGHELVKEDISILVEEIAEFLESVSE